MDEQDNLLKINAVNRFIIHPQRKQLQLYTDDDKRYYLELFNRMSRCTGQNTRDLILRQTIDTLKIKSADGKRCIKVSTVSPNEFSRELMAKGYIMNKPVPVQVQAQGIVPRPRQNVTRRIRPQPVQITRVSSSSNSMPQIDAPAQPIIPPPRRLDFSPPHEVEPPPQHPNLIRFPSSESSSSSAPSSSSASSSSAPSSSSPSSSSSSPTPQQTGLTNEQIIRIVRDTVSETIQQYLTAPSSGGRRTRKHRRRH
jgi:hypothetical protein